jgi:hypothetical protein
MKSDERSRFSYNYSDVSAASEMIWEEAVFAYFEGRYTVPTVACIVRYQAGNWHVSWFLGVHRNHAAVVVMYD